LEDPDSDPHLYLLNILSSIFSGDLSIGIVIGLLVMLVLFFFSAMISGSEIAFFSFSPAHLKAFNDEESKINQIILDLLKRPKRLLATILIANNFVNVGIVILGSFLINSIFSVGLNPIITFLIEVVLITISLLLLGEIMPKIYAAQKPIAFAVIMANPLKFLRWLFYPLSILLVRSTNIIDSRLSKRTKDISMSDLSEAIDITSDESTQEEDTRILKGIVKFSDIEVKEIMKSRVDVIAIDTEFSFKEVIDIAINSGFSRIPVYEETFDNVKGMLYVKDLLSHLGNKEDFKWQSLIRNAFFVPENKKINDLLKEFQETKVHLAIVVDEYGGTNGIVTLEDIIEEIIGEISDEFDLVTDEVDFEKIDDSTFIFEGKTSINDFCKIVGIDDVIFDEMDGEFDSIAGLILELLGEIPEKGTKAAFKYLDFVIDTVDQRRIKRIKVKINGIIEENDEE
jgi:gliding motility-associated protein GldE